MVAYNFQNAAQPVDTTSYRAMIARYGDLARACLFMVRINRYSNPSAMAQELMYLCEGAEMPGRSFETQEYRTGGSTFRRPYISTYNDITLTFVCRGEMKEKDYFDAWMELINPVQYYDFNYADEYASRIDIFQYSSAGASRNTLLPMYQMTAIDAYPVTVQPMPLSWSDDGVHRLSVQFTCAQIVRPYDTVGSTGTNTVIQGGNISNSGRLLRPII